MKKFKQWIIRVLAKCGFKLMQNRKVRHGVVKAVLNYIANKW